MSVEFLINVLGTAIGYVNMVWIYGIISKQKLKISIKNGIIFFIFAIISVILSGFLPIYIKTLYNLLCYFSLTKFFYNNEKRKWIFNSLLVWGSGTLLDIGFMSLFPLFLQKIIAKLSIFGAFVITLFLQIIHNLLCRIKLIVKAINKLWLKVEELQGLVWIYLIVILLLVIFSLLAYSNLDSLTNEIKILFLVLICISISIYIILFMYIEKTYNETSKNLLANNEYFINVNSKNRIFKHNIVHKLDGIKSVANDKAIKLIDELINEYNLNSAPIKDVDNLPNGINGLICQKIYCNKGKKLDFVINNYVNCELFDVLTPRRYNILCETLGVCLDNALNASLKSKEKILQIVLLENQSYIFIKVVNTFKSELEIDQIGSLNYSTNNNGHGLGLYSIFSRKDVRVKTSIINNLFENQIIVKKNKIKK